MLFFLSHRSFNTHIHSTAQCPCLWSYITVDTSFSEQCGILMVHEPSSYHSSPLIMQFLFLVLPFIPCGGQEESKLPLPINPLGTWAHWVHSCGIHMEIPTERTGSMTQASASNHLVLSEMQQNLRNKNLASPLRIQMDKFKPGAQF